MNWLARDIGIGIGVAIALLTAGCAVASAETEFDHYMANVRYIAHQYAITIQDGDESWEEWFWLYYFLEGKSPEFAVLDTIKEDQK